MLAVWSLAFPLLAATIVTPSAAFTPPQPTSVLVGSKLATGPHLLPRSILASPPALSDINRIRPIPNQPCRRGDATALGMYNLPPGGGGGGGGLKEILPGILTVVGLTLFFMSPLGGIFFAITNSLFALAFITPFVLLVAFQAWQFFNTIEGTCPRCSAPIRVVKDQDASPSFCLNCGALVRSNRDATGIELCNDPSEMFDDEPGFGGDVFANIWGTGRSFDEDMAGTRGGTVPSAEEQKKDQKRRERTVIDVDIEKD